MMAVGVMVAAATSSTRLTGRGGKELPDGITLEAGTPALSPDLAGDNARRKSPHTMKKQITRISIIQSSKIFVALYAIFGCLYTLVGIPLLIFGNKETMPMAIAFIIMPIVMGVMAFIFFAIGAAIYNGLSGIFGGFEVEVKDVE